MMETLYTNLWNISAEVFYNFQGIVWKNVRGIQIKYKTTSEIFWKNCKKIWDYNFRGVKVKNLTMELSGTVCF